MQIRKTTFRARLLTAFAVLFLSPSFVAAQDIASVSIDLDRADHVYAIGDEATLTIAARDANGELVHSGKLAVALTNDGRDVFLTENCDLAQTNPLVVKSSFDVPCFVKATANASSADGSSAQGILVGFAVSPEKIEVGAPKPDDFDEYWAASKKEVRAIPIDVQQEKIESLCNENRDVYSISFATVNDGRVYGYLGVPKTGEGPYPTLVNVAAGGPGFNPDLGAVDEGFVSFVMNVFPHPLPLDGNERQQLYNEYNNSLGEMYYLWNVNDRERYFFRPAILGIDRAIDWLVEQPYVDKERVGYHGMSQGGGFGLILGGMNKSFKEILVVVPALCDHNGNNKGRTAGWPQMIDHFNKDEKVSFAAPYFDAAYFAQNIDVPIVSTVGFVDTICPGGSVYAAFNSIPSKNKKMLHGLASGHTPDPNYNDALVELKKHIEE